MWHVTRLLSAEAILKSTKAKLSEPQQITCTTKAQAFNNYYMYSTKKVRDSQSVTELCLTWGTQWVDSLSQYNENVDTGWLAK